MSEINDSTILLVQNDTFCNRCLKYFGAILSGIFTIGIFAYIICSIAFLIGDYNMSSKYTQCFIWEYNLIYLIISMIRICLFYKNNCHTSNNLYIFLINSLIETLFLVYSILQYQNKSCLTIQNSNIWYLSIFSVIIQSVIFMINFIFIMMYFITFLCKFKTPCCCFD